ncbi:hypothetical protein FQN60_003471, partial [Etheostoma spectabile]
MAKVNSGASGCRAMVKAGQYLSSPSSTSRYSGQRQREMFSPQRRMASADAAGTGGKPAALAQQEQLGYFSPTDRHMQASRNLIYRDVKAFLNEVGGNPREARYWLTQFQRATSAQSPAFAVLEVDSSVFSSREMVQSLAFGLSFLQRMDMKPVVVMGRSEYEQTGPTEPVAGSRCTRGLVERSQQLTEALQQHSATVLPLFSADAPPSIAVDTSLLQWSLDCGTIPLVCPVGRDGRGCSVMLDPTDVTAAIARALQPLKVMFLNHSGGLRSQENKAGGWLLFFFLLLVLDTVSLPSDLPGLSRAAWLSAAERRRVTAIARLLNQLLTESSAVITSADTLLTELFSHRGETADTPSLSHGRGRSLKTETRYIDIISPDPVVSVCPSSYSAAAIVTMEPVNSGTPYLDKFVVSSSQQGQGTSHILWECVRQDLGKLFW